MKYFARTRTQLFHLVQFHIFFGCRKGNGDKTVELQKNSSENLLAYALRERAGKKSYLRQWVLSLAFYDQE